MFLQNLDISYTRIKTKLTHLVKSGLDKYPYKNQCQKFEGMDTKKSVRICLLASPEYRNFSKNKSFNQADKLFFSNFRVFSYLF